MDVQDVIGKLPFGDVFDCGGRTITEGEFALLTDLTWTTGRTHSNKMHMANTHFGERVLAGGIILPLMGGQASQSGYYDKIRNEHGIKTLVLIGYEDVRFKEPILPGDTMSTQVEMTEGRPTKNPRQGILKFRGVATKNDGRVVCEATQVYLFDV